MAVTTVSTANEVKQWDSDYFMEYVRGNLFSPYMGTTENHAFQVKEDLTKKKGDAITISLIGRLTGANVGSGTLEGNEEALDNYGHQVNVSVVRNAVVVNDFEEQSTVIDLRKAAKTALKNWSMDDLRDDIIEALLSINGTNFGSATSGAMTTWLDDNDDRVLFVGQSSTITGGMSANLLALTASVDTMSASALSLARRKARTADAHIRPIRVKESEEWFVFFCDSYMFRDLKNDSTIQAAQRDAWQRGQDNPIFRAGDLIYDGVIVREIPEISNKIDGGGTWGTGKTSTGPSLATAGASSARVGVGFLCGAQALGIAWAQRTKSTTEVREYGFLNGVGVQEMRGVEKLLYITRSGKTNACDHGVLTVFAAAALD